MNYFTQIPEGQIIILKNGIYQQVAAYERAGRIYAKASGGYVRLNHGGATSAPNVRWHEIDTPNGVWREDGMAVTYEANA